MAGVIISKEVAIWYWIRSFDDLKFKMKKVTVQLKKMLLEEGINRREENSYSPRVFSREFKSSIVIQSVFKCVQSIFKCDLKCVRVQSRVWNSVIQCVWVYLVWFQFEWKSDLAIWNLGMFESGKKLLLL